jgi:hypothetical protein
MLRKDCGGFCGSYGVDDGGDTVVQALTPVRETVAEVVADLRAAQRQRKLRLVQIIDLDRLEPIEPAPATMATLG